ncbi:unnamed protein product [Cercopithifilaria johnstoni]|uniref:Uncharacterized protein n=1 Tax=Cercopithifilaria johnstoni TaxID=2874296 RepID=A0A8J2M5V0_9BILA|nr:unnamed protein product [Cercopithifilaria johnstoni]
MKIVVAMIVIVIHILFHNDHSMKRRYVTLAKCVVVSQQQKQQNELSGEGSNEIIDEKITNGNAIWSTITTPCYYCDHGHLYDQYEDQYKIIATTLNTEDKNVLENINDGQKRWRKIIIEAMELQQARHYKQPLNLHHRPILEDDGNQSVNVQVCYCFRIINNRHTKEIIYAREKDNVTILETQCSVRTCTVIFAVLYNDEPIPAEIVVSDLSLLSLSRISARLKIPVESITTVVIGIAASIIAAGWLCLFVYYNSCGRPYTTTTEKPLIHTIFLKDEFIQTAENDNGGKYFDAQLRDIESNKKKSLKTISTENDSLSRIQRTTENALVKDVVSEATAVTASANTTKQYTTSMDMNQQHAISMNTNQQYVSSMMDTNQQFATSMDTNQQFDYPISIITRPRRRDLRIHKLETLSDMSISTLKEICMEEKLHPHPIPPTVSGVLEVRSFTEQMHQNPMNCL